MTPKAALTTASPSRSPSKICISIYRLSHHKPHQSTKTVRQHARGLPNIRLPHRHIRRLHTPQRTRRKSHTTSQGPSKIDCSESDPGTRGLDVSLLRVSKQIQDEAAAVFYGENTFAFALGVTKRDHALDEENRVEYLPDRRQSWSSVPRVFEANQEVRNRRPNALRSLDQSPRVLPEALKKDRRFCCCFPWR